MKRPLIQEAITAAAAATGTSHINPNGISDAEALEHELRRLISKEDISGVSVAPAETELHKETIIIDVNDMAPTGVMKVCYYAFIICGMNSKYEFHEYTQDEDGSQPGEVSKDLDISEIKTKLLYFIEDFRDRVKAEMENPTTMKAVNLQEQRRGELGKIMRDMYQQKIKKQGRKSLAECSARVGQILG